MTLSRRHLPLSLHRNRRAMAGLLDKSYTLMSAEIYGVQEIDPLTNDSGI